MLAWLLVAALVLTSPGLPCYEALAAAPGERASSARREPVPAPAPTTHASPAPLSPLIRQAEIPSPADAPAPLQLSAPPADLARTPVLDRLHATNKVETAPAPQDSPATLRAKSAQAFEDQAKRAPDSAPEAAIDAGLTALPTPAELAAPPADHLAVHNNGPPQTRSSLLRSLRVGAAWGWFNAAVMMGTVIIADKLGYVYHSDYGDPHPNIGNLPWEALARTLFWIVVAAPVSEEVLFRAGLMGGLGRLQEKLTWGRVTNFLLPGTIVALLFTAAHETSDPVLFGGRLVGALVLSRVYHRAGLMASITTHAFYNLLVTTPILLAAHDFSAGEAWVAAFAAGTPLALLAAFQQGLESDRLKNGRLVPYRITAWTALGLAGIVATQLGLWLWNTHNLNLLTLSIYVPPLLGLLFYAAQRPQRAAVSPSRWHNPKALTAGYRTLKVLGLVVAGVLAAGSAPGLAYYVPTLAAASLALALASSLKRAGPRTRRGLWTLGASLAFLTVGVLVSPHLFQDFLDLLEKLSREGLDFSER